MSITGTIFDIQRFSVHDGPGIRTTVFLKGCSLHCFWCHNPEGLCIEPQVQFLPSRCIACGACVEACPQGARAVEDGQRVYHRELCIACGKCVDVCYAEANVMAGRTATVEEVVDEVLRDRAFYEASGGGVTLSGGEPALQPAFAAAILARCAEEGLHTAVETAGNVPWEWLAALLEHSDLVMMDLKLLDSPAHRAATGVPNERILANARQLVRSGKPVLFRVPVVPGVNDDDEAIGAIAAFVHGLDGQHEGQAIALELLPFHRLAEDKYRSLGLPYRAANLEPLPRDRLAALAAVARAAGVTVRGVR